MAGVLATVDPSAGLLLQSGLGAIGDLVSGKFVEAKRQEFKDYFVEVSDWELDRYLETY